LAKTKNKIVLDKKNFKTIVDSVDGNRAIGVAAIGCVERKDHVYSRKV
jgi:hypothetical protein